MNAQRVLLIKHGALGDLIQATGVMKDIRLAFPQAQITLLTGQAYVGLMKSCPFIDEIMVDNRVSILNFATFARFVLQIKCKPFDMVIDLQNSERSRLYLHTLFRKATWVGRGRKEAEPSSGLNGLIKLLQQAEIPITFSPTPDLSWLLIDKQTLLKQYAIHTPYAVFIPGSSAKHPQKRWPHFDQLARLMTQDGLEVIAVLGPDEAALRHTLPCKILYTLSWQQLATLFKYATYVVGNDTGPSHIAAHAQARGVALFGATTLATRAEIETQYFGAIQVSDLQNLEAQTVFTWLKDRFNLP